MRYCELCKEEYTPTLVALRKGFTAESFVQKYCSRTCRQRAPYQRNKLDINFRISKIMAMAKNRAKYKSLLYDLDLPYLRELLVEQGNRCAVSGRSFQLESTDGRVNKDTVSIDRIQPDLGYTKGNVRLVTYHTNVALSEFGDQALFELCSDILNGAPQ